MAEIVKPDKQPRWATTGAAVTEPSEPKKDVGWLSAERPAFQFFNWLLLKAYSWTNYFEIRLDSTLGWNANTTLTIAADTITPTRGGHALDTEAAVALDDLKNIVTTNLDDGRLLNLVLINTARKVTIKNAAGGAGQIFTADGADCLLSSAVDRILLRRRGADWYEVARTMTSAVHNFNQFTVITAAGAGTFTVPAGVRFIEAQMIAGAGGGAGGGESGSSAAGLNGIAGTDSWVINAGNAARGGNGGGAGGGGTGGGPGAGVGGAGGAAVASIFSAQSMAWGTRAGANGTNNAGTTAGNGGTGGTAWPTILSSLAGGAGGVGTTGVGAAGTAGALYGNGGGGGAGGGGGSAGGGGGAGANGEYRTMILPVTPGSVINVFVGSGGAGVVGGNGNPGNDGGSGAAGSNGIIVIKY